ncbi:MAG TPA: CDP-diacylglycerol--glycerol-3-phosphate 3-phosphatidyltransferase [Spirochaetes bacterium]|nr:CDP-diacylglycerol--glycerol-3-phosphate 3-phosphatidyltransferase [Spirochaetota bacterium]
MGYKDKIRLQAANIITLFRVILVPFFIYALFGKGVLSGFAALLIFITASISDYFDGYFARKFDTHSKLGEFLDPLADKILTGGAFISFIILPDFYVPFWPVLVILMREITVTIFRLLAIKKNKQIRTEFSGKIKTAVQMFSVICILSLLCIKKIYVSLRPEYDLEGGPQIWNQLVGPRGGPVLYYLPLILISVSAIFAIFSLVQYMMKNREILFGFSGKRVLNSAVKLFASGFFTGYIPFASGTFGTVLGCAVWVLLSRTGLYYAAAAVFVILGFAVSGYAQKKVFFEEDSPRIVIDEIAGILVAFVTFKFLPGLPGLVYLASGFLFFRFFDILKPFPIKNIQKVRAGAGVMLDDLLAAVFTNIVLQLIRIFIFEA